MILKNSVTKIGPIYDNLMKGNAILKSLTQQKISIMWIRYFQNFNWNIIDKSHTYKQYSPSSFKHILRLRNGLSS